MVEEAMIAVKKAETEADGILKSAREQAEDIRKQAEAQIVRLKDEAEVKAQDYLKDSLAKTDSKGAQDVQAAKEAAAKEADRMLEKAKADESKVVAAILDELLK